MTMFIYDDGDNQAHDPSESHAHGETGLIIKQHVDRSTSHPYHAFESTEQWTCTAY